MSRNLGSQVETANCKVQPQIQNYSVKKQCQVRCSLELVQTNSIGSSWFKPIYKGIDKKIMGHFALYFIMSMNTAF